MPLTFTKEDFLVATYMYFVGHKFPLIQFFLVQTKISIIDDSILAELAYYNMLGNCKDGHFTKFITALNPTIIT